MTPDQFVTDAIRTESRIENITLNKTWFFNLTDSIVALGNILDQVKKNTFYNKPYDEKKILELLNTARKNTEYLIEDVETGYWTCPDQITMSNLNPRIFHSIVGITTEAVELLEAMDTHPDAVNLREEFGDLMWYVAIGVDETGGNFDSVLDKVIAKLKARYPNKFNSDNAINRDLVKERAILESQEGAHLDSPDPATLEPKAPAVVKASQRERAFVCSECGTHNPFHHHYRGCSGDV